jgi:hypothetical protein
MQMILRFGFDVVSQLTILLVIYVKVAGSGGYEEEKEQSNG